MFFLLGVDFEADHFHAGFEGVWDELVSLSPHTSSNIAKLTMEKHVLAVCFLMLF